jgi:hypothetical protein
VDSGSGSGSGSGSISGSVSGSVSGSIYGSVSGSGSGFGSTSGSGSRSGSGSESEGEDITRLTVAVLKERLVDLGLDTNGRKGDLIQRLEEAEEVEVEVFDANKFSSSRFIFVVVGYRE